MLDKKNLYLISLQTCNIKKIYLVIEYRDGKQRWKLRQILWVRDVK